MRKYNCYECGEEIEIELTRVDIGHGDYYYFCDNECRDKFIDYNTDIKVIDDECE